MTEAEAQIRAALAAGPTPGPWYLRTNRHPTTDGRAWGWLDTQPPGGSQYAPPGLQITWERGSKSEANADYIAACSPENIAALLADHAEREAALRAEVEALRAERDALFHARQAAFERAAQQCEIVAHNAMDVGYAQVCADCAHEIRRIAQHERNKELFGDD